MFHCVGSEEDVKVHPREDLNVHMEGFFVSRLGVFPALQVKTRVTLAKTNSKLIARISITFY